VARADYLACRVKEVLTQTDFDTACMKDDGAWWMTRRGFNGLLAAH
jgi:hypothetical protein